MLAETVSVKPISFIIYGAVYHKGVFLDKGNRLLTVTRVADIVCPLFYSQN